MRRRFITRRVPCRGFRNLRCKHECGMSLLRVRFDPNMRAWCIAAGELLAVVRACAAAAMEIQNQWQLLVAFSEARSKETIGQFHPGRALILACDEASEDRIVIRDAR